MADELAVFSNKEIKVPRIYLAGPMVFYEDPVSIFDAMKEICSQHGLVGIAPLDNQIGLEGLAPGKPTISKIVRADCDLMSTLDGGIFCMNPMWGAPEMDTGTANEIGFMMALKKPMSGWTTDGRPYPEKVSAYFHHKGITETAANSLGGTSGNKRAPNGMLIHSDGCIQNGMNHMDIEHTGGKIFADADWKIAFEAAVMYLAREQFNLKPAEPLYIRDRTFIHLAV